MSDEGFNEGEEFSEPIFEVPEVIEEGGEWVIEVTPAEDEPGSAIEQLLNDEDQDAVVALEEAGFDTSDVGRGNKAFNAKTIGELTGTTSSEASRAGHDFRDALVEEGEIHRGDGSGAEHPEPEVVEAYPLDTLEDVAFEMDEMAESSNDMSE